MDIVIIGAGGQGKVVLDIVRSAGRDRVVGFVDADASLAGKVVSGLPVLGTPNLLPKIRQKTRAAIVAIGTNVTRVEYSQMLAELGFEQVNAIHPTASVSTTARLGQNLVIGANAVVATEAWLEDSVIVNNGAIVDHECQIGQGCHVCPGAKLAGRVTLDPLVFVGLGANIIQCLHVGQHAVVGAGATVIADVPAYATVVGVPARVVKLQAPIEVEA